MLGLHPVIHVCTPGFDSSGQGRHNLLFALSIEYKNSSEVIDAVFGEFVDDVWICRVGQNSCIPAAYTQPGDLCRRTGDD